jgi:starch-binding outer membrane protein, SusD/RagB family
MEEALKGQYVAEARFIRALGYFHLVRLWGPVPLRTEPVVDLNSLAAPRAPIERVYTLIVEDLQSAEANLPDRYGASDIGRATKWAAKTLLADVYLTREQWAEAAAKAREVMESGRFSLVPVRQADDFLQVFGPTVLESSEEIIAAKFVTGSGPQTSLVSFSHHQSAGYSTSGFRTLLGDVNSAVLAGWDSTDLRRAYNLYSASERDRQFLIAAEPELFKKYREQSANGGTDIHIYRYAEALLVFAEADAMASGAPTPAAYDAVNRVRRRAYGLDPDTASSVDLAGLPLAEFRDAVLMERAHEFTLEAKRWFDLVRTRQALAVIQALNEPITDKNLLWPIPLEELATNMALSAADQNPGW